MEYIIKSATPKQIPYTNKKNEYGIDVLLITGIVNQTYAGFENIDMGFCQIEKTDSVNEIEFKINAFAKAFVLNKYKRTV